MVDELLLEKQINKSGYKKGFLAEKCGITATSFSAKCHNRAEFNVPEVQILCSVLGIKDLSLKEAIFFAPSNPAAPIHNARYEEKKEVEEED